MINEQNKTCQNFKFTQTKNINNSLDFQQYNRCAVMYTFYIKTLQNHNKEIIKLIAFNNN